MVVVGSVLFIFFLFLKSILFATELQKIYYSQPNKYLKITVKATIPDYAFKNSQISLKFYIVRGVSSYFLNKTDFCNDDPNGDLKQTSITIKCGSTQKELQLDSFSPGGEITFDLDSNYIPENCYINVLSTITYLAKGTDQCQEVSVQEEIENAVVPLEKPVYINKEPLKNWNFSLLLPKQTFFGKNKFEIPVILNANLQASLPEKILFSGDSIVDTNNNATLEYFSVEEINCYLDNEVKAIRVENLGFGEYLIVFPSENATTNATKYLNCIFTLNIKNVLTNQNKYYNATLESKINLIPYQNITY